jgi:hypothetical protein
MHLVNGILAVYLLSGPSSGSDGAARDSQISWSVGTRHIGIVAPMSSVVGLGTVRFLTANRTEPRFSNG